MIETKPLPYHVTEAGYIASNGGGFVPLIIPFTDEANRDQHRGATPEAMAHAMFLTHAANCHDELVAACKAALRIHRRTREQIFGTDAHEEMLREVIAKAERREP